MYLTPYEIYRKLTVKDSIPATHVKQISDTLIHITLNDDYYNRLCVSQPPRTAKSSLITLSYPFWLILNDPNTNIIIVNNTKTLAENFGIRLRQLFIDYQELLGLNNIRISDKKSSNTWFIFEDNEGQLYDGSIKLTGTGGTITGQDVDILICDDLVKGFQDTTPTQLDKTIEWFKTIILQRLEPHSKLIILGTRWASNDVIGYLQENNPSDYKFIQLKALNDDGTCIWRERYNPEFFQERCTEIGERLFNALYQQQPLDTTGSFFNLDNLLFGEFTSYDSSLNVRSWDLAYSDESKGDINDYTASCKMYKTPDNKYYITNVTMEQYGDRLNKELKRTAYLDSQNTPIIIETGTKGGASRYYYNDLENIYLKGYRVSQSEPIGSKVDRATPFRDAILDGKVVLDLDERQSDILLKQLQGFPLAKHDDLIDACAYAYNYLQDKTPRIMKPRTHKRERIRL